MGKLSAYTALSVGQVASGDLVPLIDVSDTSAGPAGTNKVATVETLVGGPFVGPIFSGQGLGIPAGANVSGYTPSTTSGVAFGTALPVRPGKAIAGVTIYVGTGQSGKDARIAMYNADSANGLPTGSPLVDSLISVSTVGHKTVAFSATPTQSLIWMFLGTTEANMTWRSGGWNNNSGGNLFLPRYASLNWETQLPMKITGMAAGFPTGSSAVVSAGDWQQQPAFGINY